MLKNEGIMSSRETNVRKAQNRSLNACLRFIQQKKKTLKSKIYALYPGPSVAKTIGPPLIEDIRELLDMLHARHWLAGEVGELWLRVWLDHR